jgi:hypothetical protein
MRVSRTHSGARRLPYGAPFKTPIEPYIDTNRGSRASARRRDSADMSNPRCGGYK